MKEDYCTMSPDWIFGKYIGGACKEHDIHYRHHDVTRAEADSFLRRDIQCEAWWLYPIGWIYWLGVRLFGGSHYENT